MPPYRLHNEQWNINENQILFILVHTLQWNIEFMKWNLNAMIVQALYMAIGIISNVNANLTYVHNVETGLSYQLYLDSWSAWENEVSFTSNGVEQSDHLTSRRLQIAMILSIKIALTVLFSMDNIQIAPVMQGDRIGC